MDSRRNWTVDHYQVWTAWQEQVRKAVRRPWLVRALLHAETRARFFTCYGRLRALPRQTRRALQRRLAQSLAGLALVLALGQGQGLAATFNIPCPGGVGNNTALIQAIDDANNEIANPGADTINLVAGCTHTLTTAIPSGSGDNGLPLVTTTITIAGNGSTIARDAGVPNFQIVEVSPTGNLTLQNLTLTGGVIGITNRGISTLTNCTVSGNTGGGVVNIGTFTLANSDVSDNTAGSGVRNSGDMTVTNSTVSGNTAQAGGGINNSTLSTLTLTNSTISGNSAGYGGGIDSTNGTITLTNCTVSGNTAYGNGGGLYNARSSMTLTNSTVSGNTATNRGGGVNNLGPLTLTNSTISGNTASIGGGVNNYFYTLTLTRTVVSGNTASTTPEVHLAGGTLTADDFNLFGVNGDAGVVGFTPDTTDSDMDGKVDLVPAAGVMLSDILSSLANNGGPTQTHALVAGSPAVDAVTDGSCPPPATDQRGVARPQGAACDSGAFEFNPLLLNHFLCYTTKATKGNTCTSDSGNPGAACAEESDCGGTEDVSAFCVPNKFPKGLQVTLTDQFETALLDIQKPTSLCNPANKNGEDPTALTDPDHLAAYQIKPPTKLCTNTADSCKKEEECGGVTGETSFCQKAPPHEKQTNLQVDNQFGTLKVDTVKPSRLLVPTAKSESGPVPEPTPLIDHFKCYTVKISKNTPKFVKGLQASVVDQFNQSKTYDVVKPTRLCTPADKDGESPGAETHVDHLMCYQVKPIKGAPKHTKVLNIHVNNQFGPERVDTIKEEELCVPSSKTRP